MAVIQVNGYGYDDEFVGDVVKAAATIIADNDKIEDGSTSDASLRATGTAVGVLTKAILAELRR